MLVLFAFSWETEVQKINDIGILNKIEIEEDMINVILDKPEPPPPPKIIKVPIFKIVPDEKVIEKEFAMRDQEPVDETEIIIIDFPEPDPEPTEVFGFYDIQEKPLFPGGTAALLNFLSSSTNYPPIAAENDVSGVVYVGFVIDTDGSITDAKILKKVDPALDKEALRVVKSMPKWKPGTQRERPVQVSFQVPIKFVLRN